MTDVAGGHPSFHLRMNAEAVGLMEEGGVVCGVRYEQDGKPRQIRAPLTVAADGRHSALRQDSGLVAKSVSPAIDVLWFRIPRRDDQPQKLALVVGPGHILLFINRFEYWQVAYSIPKGGADELRAGGLDAFTKRLAEPKPEFGDRFRQLSDWDQIKLLTVQSNRLSRWHRPGLLLIGDAAHAMSPMGGVGINLAIQDAVAAANIVAEPLRTGRLTEGHLHRVQRRRQWPTVVTQGLQRTMERRVAAPALAGEQAVDPRFFSLLRRFPFLTALSARLIGFGVRRERVRLPAA